MADRMAKTEPDKYADYLRRSCDLTMRGGTTSGVIYPLAVCALAEHYMFRSVGGASAGAIGASATAAAEYGRYAEPVGPIEGDKVRPGFAGLAGLVIWLVSGKGDARWRMPQLFQPKASLHKLFRLIAALMQGKATTGRVRFTSVLVAVVTAVKPLATVTLFLSLALWLLGPYSLRWVLPPDAWDGTHWIVAAVLAAVALVAAVWTVKAVAPRFGRITFVLLIPLVLGLSGLFLYRLDLSAWLVGGTVVVTAWLVLTFAVVAAFALIYGTACWPVIMNYRKHRFGLIPGAEAYTPNALDRWSGMAKSTGVPPLATWLADRIDDLAGIDHSRALTFGDLWHGPGRPRGGSFVEGGERVINLALMTTDLSGSRPYQLPFQPDDRWQFCPECLKGVVPDRIIKQMCVSVVDDASCRDHKVSLQWLPEPADMPVVMAARMSLPLPALICPVPLFKDGRPHWFSDGGITSNFPIHFFDSLLPRWPTFGLSLSSEDTKIRKDQEVILPDQDASTAQQPYTEVGPSVLSFFGRILNTFMDWRDTMQSALPGFRGRIATIQQGPGEGGTNLFMQPEVIARLALRGRDAGTMLKERFTAQFPDEAEGFTRTDRYRWIRMRLALREYREVAFQAEARSLLYKERAARYPIPAEMSAWFHGPHKPPMPEPYTQKIDGTFDHMISLAGNELAEEFDGTSPVNPVLRLTPLE
ncbi:putative acylesterase/phospholipase RssA [Kibdelosporangium banguiense]|uniref:Acylesterase/phospholipase RssA n=2 Tax=Kibdelosporangium banguiense TaxID=1365924 RepID=A0ABS4TL26_9PSEU|nr:putative acylesterase/phospholipase RssA [Kibdelosporangium banguiense]